ISYLFRSFSTAWSSSACNLRYSSLIRLPAAGSSASAFSARSARRLPALLSSSRNLSRICLMSSIWSLRYVRRAVPLQQVAYARDVGDATYALASHSVSARRQGSKPDGGGSLFLGR